MRDERGHRNEIRKREYKNDSASFVCPCEKASLTATTSLSVRSGASLLCLSPALASSPLLKLYEGNTSASGEGRKPNAPAPAHASLSMGTAEKKKLENKAEEHVQRQCRFRMWLLRM